MARLGPDAGYERWRWQTFLITWFAYAGFNLTRMSFAVSKVGLENDAHVVISERQMAGIDGAFLAAYAIGQFFWGFAGDRFGTRKVVLAGMLSSVVVSLVMGSCSTITMFVVLFFVQGLCQSSGWAPLVKNVGNFFSLRERGFILGLWCTNYAVGGLAASVIASYSADRLGWRFAFYVPAFVLFCIWVLFLLFQRDSPEDVGLPPVEQYHGEEAPSPEAGSGGSRPEEARSWEAIREAVTNPMVLLLGAVYFCLKPTRYAIMFWGPKYIYEKLGSSMTEAGFLSALFELAGPLSILCAGVLSDRVFAARRMPVSILSLFLLAGLLLLLDHLPQSRVVLGCALFMIGFLAYPPDAMIGGIAAMDFASRRGASSATGIVNGMGSLGALAGGVVPGLLQSASGWNSIFAGLAAAALLAGILLLPKWNAMPPPRRSIPASR